MRRVQLAEYIWLDGNTPQQLRSKTKVLDPWIGHSKETPYPEWGFDGSSTNQAEGKDSDCILKPVYSRPDPIRGWPHTLVLCEVFNKDGSPHPSNTRIRLREAVEKYKNEEPWFGIEQEYTLFKNTIPPWPLGWPENGYPTPQGHSYCGVGADKVCGRQFVETHMNDCLEACLKTDGHNSEVMKAQWEDQIGPLDPLQTSDQLNVDRWLLHRRGEDYNLVVSLEPKPVRGDWNGAGGHTNFSTKKMREAGGMEFIEEACKKLSKRHLEHIVVYGEHNQERLTGKHETCSINEFRYGKNDRGASIRIPLSTVLKMCGYLEDRRPAANLDPYMVCTAILETVCGNGFDPAIFCKPVH